jgi:cystathionine beta-lyase
MTGFGAMLSFRLEKNIDPLKFLNALELIKDVLSLGGVETTILSPAKTSHSLLTEAERQNQGIDNHLLRLSCGIEEVEDLIDDFEACIQKIR